MDLKVPRRRRIRQREGCIDQLINRRGIVDEDTTSKTKTERLNQLDFMKAKTINLLAAPLPSASSQSPQYETFCGMK